jgi:hypothetical protein
MTYLRFNFFFIANVLLFVQMNVVPSGIWKSLPRLVEVYNFFLRSWLISFDFPVMSSKEARSLKVHAQVYLQWTQMMSINLSGTSKAMTSFSGIFVAV